METTQRKPLAGIKVVEMSTYVAAPTCARLLADMGADVIKIESLSGDPWRAVAKANTLTGDDEVPVFDVYNGGKKSICLNIRSEDGLKILHKMLSDADIFITNTRAASLKKHGLDYETLKEIYPRLIYVTLNGYGEKGAEASAPGFDNVAFWTRSGFLLDMPIETENYYPTTSPTAAGDTVTGSMLFGGVMTALYQRTVTGKGDRVSTALYNSGIWMLASMVLQAQDAYGVKFPKSRAESSPFASPYRCADGEWICITILDFLRYRDTVFHVLGIEEEMKGFDLPSLGAMKQNSRAIIPIMERAFAKKTSEEWLKELKAVDVVCSRMGHISDICRDPQAIVNDFVYEYHFRNGRKCMMPSPPIRLQSQGAAKPASAPMAGEDTAAVLQDFGYTQEQIDTWKQQGVIG